MSYGEAATDAGVQRIAEALDVTHDSKGLSEFVPSVKT
jgi:hypothetical protein